jgi:hypothetical protein
MIKDVEIRRATADDIRLFYPEGSPLTCYAWIALYKGQPACLAGVTLQKRAMCVAFCDMKPDINAPKITIWRAAKVMFGEMKKLGLPMVAVYCEPSPAGQAFVKRLGFEYLYTRDGQEVFKCH